MHSQLMGFPPVYKGWCLRTVAMGDILEEERTVAISTRQWLKWYWGLPLGERLAALPPSHGRQQ